MDVENPVRAMRSIKVEKRLPQVVGEKDAARLVEAEVSVDRSARRCATAPSSKCSIRPACA